MKSPLFVVFMIKISENFINDKSSKKSAILATHCVLAHYKCRITYSGGGNMQITLIWNL